MDVFSELERTLESCGAAAALELLVQRLDQDGKHSDWFNARLMQKRHELGLPLTGPLDDLSDELRRDYDAFVREEARQAGMRFLRDAQIAEAWRYFRAIGEPLPVAEAIEKLTPDEASDDAVAIALQEGANPRKGFELALSKYGICRAITIFGQYPDAATREQALRLLAQTLHTELVANLKRAIERQEGAAPASTDLRELVAGREWLFGEYDYYVDTSHLDSVLRHAMESGDERTLRLAIELAEYGKRLSTNFRQRGEPPFDVPYEDHAVFLRALAGEQVDEAIKHFRRKAEETDPELVGTYPAQVLVRFLLRLDRPRDAVAVFEEFLGESDPAYLSCPGYEELCRLAGDFEKLQSLARKKDDAVGFLEAMVASRHLA